MAREMQEQYIRQTALLAVRLPVAARRLITPVQRPSRKLGVRMFAQAEACDSELSLGMPVGACPRNWDSR